MSEHGKLRTVLDSAATVCVTAASLAILWSVWTNRSGAPAPPVSAASPGVVENVEAQSLKIPLKLALGSKASHAKIAIIEFSDFECPFCGRYARETLPSVKQTFVETGQVAYGFRHFPIETIHTHALDAAVAARCANQQGKFWEMHDWLFSNQTNLAADRLMSHARDLHLNEASFQKCLGDSAAEVRAEAKEGERLGVRSTPTFFVGEVSSDGTVVLKRRINGAVSYEVFKTTIQDALRASAKG
jgi:protein-disulfide isomerase